MTFSELCEKNWTRWIFSKDYSQFQNLKFQTCKTWSWVKCKKWVSPTYSMSQINPKTCFTLHSCYISILWPYWPGFDLKLCLVSSTYLYDIFAIHTVALWQSLWLATVSGPLVLVAIEREESALTFNLTKSRYLTFLWEKIITALKVPPWEPSIAAARSSVRLLVPHLPV